MNNFIKGFRSSESLRTHYCNLLNSNLNNLKLTVSGKFSNPISGDLGYLEPSEYRMQFEKEFMSISNAYSRLVNGSEALKNFYSFLAETQKFFNTANQLDEYLFRTIVLRDFISSIELKDLMEEVHYSDNHLFKIDANAITMNYLNVTQTKVPALVKKFINKGYVNWRLFDAPNACDAVYIKDLEKSYNQVLKCTDIGLGEMGLIRNFNLDMEHDAEELTRKSRYTIFLAIINESPDELDSFNNLLKGMNVIIYRLKDKKIFCKNKDLL